MSNQLHDRYRFGCPNPPLLWIEQDQLRSSQRGDISSAPMSGAYQGTIMESYDSIWEAEIRIAGIHLLATSNLPSESESNAQGWNDD